MPPEYQAKHTGTNHGIVHPDAWQGGYKGVKFGYDLMGSFIANEHPSTPSTPPATEKSKAMPMPRIQLKCSHLQPQHGVRVKRTALQYIGAISSTGTRTYSKQTWTVDAKNYAVGKRTGING